METPLEFATIPELAAQMRAGGVSPVKLAEATLDRISALDKRLHAFIAVSADRALAEARAAETLLKNGHDRGPLQGVPYAVKDLYDVKGIATTAGTRLSFAKTLSARLIDLRSVWGLETLETGTRPGVRVARRRPGGDKILGATQNDPEERCKQPA